MHQELRSQLSRYALAVAVVAVAAALTYLLLLAHIRLPFAVFYGAVIVGARYGGRLPRLLPLPPSAGARYFFAPPGNAPAICVFALVALFIWYLTQKHRHAEESLRRRERELTDFFENATVGLHWVGADGTILWTNRAELEMLGYARDEYIGHSITEFHADPQVISDILARVGRGEELHGYEARLRCKDGSIRHVMINSNVLWEGGRFVHTRCFTRDVTDLKRAAEERERLLAAEREAREEAERSELRYRSLVAASSQLVWSTDAAGQIVDMPEWRAITGQTRDEVSGRGWLDAVHPEDRERVARAWDEALRARGTYSVEYRIRSADNGGYRHVS